VNVLATAQPRAAHAATIKNMGEASYAGKSVTA
jgi:hypothetical protein